MRQTFQQEEAEQILVEAVRRSAEQESLAINDPVVTGGKLLEMAEELGVSQEILASVVRDREAAISQSGPRTGMTSARRDFVRHRRVEFLAHFAAFGLFNFLLITLWSRMWPQEGFWPKWVLLGWGVLLCWHGIALIQTKGSEFERELALWQVRRHKRRSKQALKRKPSEEREA